MADTEPKDLENPTSNHTANGLAVQNGNSNKDSAQLPAAGKKLSADAPAFNVSRSPTLDPYHGPNGIRTQPCYVPPATIPPPAQQANPPNTNSNQTPQQPQQQQQTASNQPPPQQQQQQSGQPQQASPQQPQQQQQGQNPHGQQRQKSRSRQQYPPSYDPHNDPERDQRRQQMYPHNYQQKMPPQHMGHPRHPHGQYQMGHPQHGKYPAQYPYAMNRNVQHPNQPPYDPHYRHHQQMMGRHPNQYAAPNREHGPYGMHPPYPPHPNGTHGSSQHLSSNGAPITSPPQQQQVNGNKMSSNGQHSSNQMPSHPAASPPDHTTNGNNKHSSQQPNGTTSKTTSNSTTATTKQPGKVQFKTFTNQKNARAVGSTMAYKHPSRSHYGQPEAKLRDPKFTNPSGLLHLQRWELLESAKRWLPGEGTLITWKNHRYLIGPPIHMGMNGHIHYCYKYPLPKDKRTRSKSKDKDNKDGKGDKDDEATQEEEDENIQEIDINSPCVETLAAKIVPNTPAFAREIVILRALQHCENVTELYEVLESERTLISILELAQADVYNFFVGRGSSRHGWNLDKPAVREHFSKMVISNVVQGLDQMHKAEYLHCDLKSLNILLYIYVTDHSNRRGGVYIKAKLTDFGHSSHGTTRIAEKLFSNGMARVGTAGHVAPELFKEGTKCTEKIDIWSLGIVMFSMLVPGRLLFSEYTNLDALKRGYDRLNKMNPWSRDRPSWWTDFERLSPEARDLILWMTRYDPSQRPTCNEILKHPWFLIGKQGHREHYRPKLKYVDMLCSSSIAQE